MKKLAIIVLTVALVWGGGVSATLAGDHGKVRATSDVLSDVDAQLVPCRDSHSRGRCCHHENR
jgi:hypothetical protein